MINKKIWIIGTGEMSIEYSKVLESLKCDFTVIGRGKIKCAAFIEKSGQIAIEGGLEAYLNSNPPMPNAVIVAVGIEALSDITIMLLEYGVKNILVEKPGVGYADEIINLTELVTNCNANVMLAYNRRFYASIIKAKELIEADGGVESFTFEFTEWSHVIETLNKHETELQNWFLGNSTHVIDTAFYLGSKPKEICCYNKGGLNWHKISSIFVGAGICENKALFSYQANWEGPGRWVIEILTKKHRYILKPLEKLQIQKLGSVSMEFVEEIDYSLDEIFKPGLYLQTKAFLEGDYNDFCDIFEQKFMLETVYCKMSGYLYK